MRFHNCAWVCQADGTGSVDGGRPKGLPYPIPEKFLRTVGAAPCGRPRAGLGPAPTRGRNSFCIRRRGVYQPPESLLPAREKVPSVCEADEGGLRNGSSYSAGRPVSGPYEKEGTVSKFAVGAAISRPKALSLPGRRCRAYARRMRVGSGMAVALRWAGQCPAPTKKKEPLPDSP